MNHTPRRRGEPRPPLTALKAHLYTQAVRYRIYAAVAIVVAYLLAQGHIDASLAEMIGSLAILLLGVESVNKATVPKDKAD